MPARHRSRQRALQVLFLCDLNRQPVDEAIEHFYDTLFSEENPGRPEPDRFMETLARGASGMAAAIDGRIAGKAAHWSIGRMPVVDRNILRIALYEMTALGTPAAIAIDEALELARQFSGEESVAFINGVLDALHKEKASS